jgi:hypothetical protein
VLSYSALGYSLPDLTVRGFGGPVASYGQTLTTSITVSNIGSSTINEPLHLTQGSNSTADAPSSVVDVYASNHPGAPAKLYIGSTVIPPVSQNSFVTVNPTFTLPSSVPKSFAKGPIYLTFISNFDRSVPEANYANNAFISSQPIRITPALPNLQLIGFDVPSYIAPGDQIQPGLRIANIGPVDFAAQGPLTVQIVASQNETFGPGDQILATYTVDSIPGIATAPTANVESGNRNVQPGGNIITLNNQIITLPALPGKYFLGVKINPQSTIVELGKHPTPQFDALVKVGPPLAGRPASVYGLAGNPGATLPQFPYPLGAANVGITVNAGGITTASVGQQQASTIASSNGASLNVFAQPTKVVKTIAPNLLNSKLSGTPTQNAKLAQTGFPGALLGRRFTKPTS